MMLKDAPKNVTLIDPDDGMKIKVLSDYGSEQVRIQVIDVGSYTGRDYIAGNTKVISKYHTDYEIFKEPDQTKVSSATIAALETDIKNMEKNLESAKSNLEKAKKDLKKSIPALVVGGLYRIPENHSFYHASTILVISFDVDYVKVIQFFDYSSVGDVSHENLYTEELNDGTLIHLTSAEDKKFAKYLFELTKNY